MLWKPRFIAVFIPAWDESLVIAPMLKATLKRFEHPDYRLFVGYYRNDPATASAIASVADPRIEPVEVPVDGPTTKADCLNHLYDALLTHETTTGRSPIAIVLHDAEDVVHPFELTLFDQLIDRAALIQLPVQPLVDPASTWISGHYCDEFAESHGKELVVREAVGAAIPLAGVGCAIERHALAKLAAAQEGRPFVGTSMTEDYEMGLRLGALGFKTMFVRIPAQAGSYAVVSSRGHFPASLDAAVRQKARWIGGIAFAGWDRLGWQGGIGERWMRMRSATPRMMTARAKRSRSGFIRVVSRAPYWAPTTPPTSSSPASTMSTDWVVTAWTTVVTALTARIITRLVPMTTRAAMPRR